MNKPALRDDDTMTGATAFLHPTIGGVPHLPKPDFSVNAEKIDTKLHDEAVEEGKRRCGKFLTEEKPVSDPGAIERNQMVNDIALQRASQRNGGQNIPASNPQSVAAGDGVPSRAVGGERNPIKGGE